MLKLSIAFKFKKDKQDYIRTQSVCKGLSFFGLLASFLILLINSPHKHREG